MLRPNNNQLYSDYVSLLIPIEIPTIPENTTYNKSTVISGIAQNLKGQAFSQFSFES